jgi:hypothetical protein
MEAVEQTKAEPQEGNNQGEVFEPDVLAFACEH